MSCKLNGEVLSLNQSFTIPIPGKFSKGLTGEVRTRTHMDPQPQARAPFGGLVSVLVLVGFTVHCVMVLGAAGEEVRKRRVNKRDLRDDTPSCLVLQNRLVGIMSPLL
jgi:hypothetical protein